MSTVFVRELRYLRHELDARGLHERTLLAVCDGSFCNRTCFNADVPGTKIIARTRKNTHLRLRVPASGRRFYAPEGFSPEEVRMDPTRPYQTASIFYGGASATCATKRFKKSFGRLPLNVDLCVDRDCPDAVFVAINTATSTITSLPTC